MVLQDAHKVFLKLFEYFGDTVKESIVATAHRFDAVDRALMKAIVLAPVPKKEVPATKAQWLRRLQEYAESEGDEEADEEDVLIRASRRRLALDEQEMETNAACAPGSSSGEGAAPLLALGERSEIAVPPPSLLVPAAGGEALVVYRPGPQEVSPAVANAQERTQEAKRGSRENHRSSRGS